MWQLAAKITGSIAMLGCPAELSWMDLNAPRGASKPAAELGVSQSVLAPWRAPCLDGASECARFVAAFARGYVSCALASNFLIHPSLLWSCQQFLHCFQIFFGFVCCGRCNHVSQLEISMIGLAVIAPVRQGFNRSRVRKRGWNRRDAEKSKVS